MNILLCISGSIAAYKTPHLVRLFKAAGHNLRVCLSPNADQFVAPLSLQAVCEHEVYQTQFPPTDANGMEHIRLARWADLLLVAPASASMIAKLAHAHADDLITTIALAFTGTKCLAPAMNQAMWSHPGVAHNCEALRTQGWHLLPVDEGAQACGEFGAGRMLEPEALVQALTQITHTTPQAQWWQGVQLLITAGPTYEAIDPVRYIGNRSSGKMGYALAQVAADYGASVVLVSGPTALPDPRGVQVIRITSAKQMLEAVMPYKHYTVCIAAAAVADYTPSQPGANKLHKSGDTMHITLTKNPDIVAYLSSQRSSGQRIVGFCAETLGQEDLLKRAQSKRTAKNLDLIVANKVGHNLVFDQTDAELWLVGANTETHLPLASKTTQAKRILAAITALEL